jgi:uncharacterized protein YjbI with pentapeptide repeats
LLGLAALLSTGLALSLTAPERSGDWRGFTLGTVSELVGAGTVYLLLDQAIGRKLGDQARRDADRRGTAGEQARRVEELGSRVREVAIAAAEELRQRGWLYDGTLGEAYLAGANLREADLAKAVLQGADLHRADLAGACLSMASLREADLSFAKLEGADLGDANLTRSDLSFAEGAGANLENANATRSDLSFARLAGARLAQASLTRSNLSHAELIGAHLQGASLREADLKFADLSEALLDEATELPDGTRWTEHADLSRFTYPKHPEFWRSDDPVSPAFRGKAGD